MPSEERKEIVVPGSRSPILGEKGILGFVKGNWILRSRGAPRHVHTEFYTLSLMRPPNSQRFVSLRKREEICSWGLRAGGRQREASGHRPPS